MSTTPTARIETPVQIGELDAYDMQEIRRALQERGEPMQQKKVLNLLLKRWSAIMDAAGISNFGSHDVRIVLLARGVAPGGEGGGT